jgi:hypothetical protein
MVTGRLLLIDDGRWYVARSDALMIVDPGQIKSSEIHYPGRRRLLFEILRDLARTTNSRSNTSARSSAASIASGSRTALCGSVSATANCRRSSNLADGPIATRNYGILFRDWAETVGLATKRSDDPAHHGGE